MEFHYVVKYDTDVKKWSVEVDTNVYFNLGNIFDYGASFTNANYGWRKPMNMDEYNTDIELHNTLRYIVDTFPIPGEQSNKERNEYVTCTRAG